MKMAVFLKMVMFLKMEVFPNIVDFEDHRLRRSGLLAAEPSCCVAMKTHTVCHTSMILHDYSSMC